MSECLLLDEFLAFFQSGGLPSFPRMSHNFCLYYMDATCRFSKLFSFLYIYIAAILSLKFKHSMYVQRVIQIKKERMIVNRI